MPANINNNAANGAAIPTLYLFSIGGSGARVLYSLTMLLASGVKINCNKIVPVVVDTDFGNKNLKNTIQLIEEYSSIRTKLYPTGNTKEIFKTEIAPIVKVQVDGRELGSLRTVIAETSMTQPPFETLKKETSLLFTNEDLDMPLAFGFIGRPHIGTVVLNHLFEKSVALQGIMGAMAGHHILLINSFFGGTGAAGYPALVNKLANDPRFNGSTLGGISLTPYYGFNTDKKEVQGINGNTYKVDAGNFEAKTNAALDYYDTYLQEQLDIMYYAGDDGSKSAYTYCLGGENQHNPAHVVEMIAAYSAIHFTSQTKGNATQFYSSIFNNDNNTALDLKDITDANLRSGLMRFWMVKLFWQNYLNRHLKTESKPSYIEYLNLNANITAGLGAEINQFIDKFVRWAKELAGDNQNYHTRTFTFAQYSVEPEEANIHTIFKGATSKRENPLFGAEHDVASHFVESLNAKCRPLKGKPLGNGLYATLFDKVTETIDEILNNKINY